jgi:hypothetical protein
MLPVRVGLFQACGEECRYPLKATLYINNCRCRIWNPKTTVAELCLMAPKRSGQVARIEPEGAELLEAYSQMAQRFKDVGWFEFLTTFQGYDEQVSMEFALNFDGHEVKIGKMLMLVTEQTITKACRLVVGGERWWKKEYVVTKFVNQFLLLDKQNLDWRRGIPRSWV